MGGIPPHKSTSPVSKPSIYTPYYIHIYNFTTLE